MRRNRVIFLLLWLLSLAGLHFFGGIPCVCLTALLTLLPAAAYLYIRLAAGKIRLKQEAEETELVAGQPAVLHIYLKNASGVPVSDLKAVFFPDHSAQAGEKSLTQKRLGRGQKLKITGRILLKSRGEYCAGVSSVTVSDPLRLFRVPLRVEPLKVLVWPDYLRDGEEKVLGGLLSDAGAARRQGGSAAERSGASGELTIRKRIGEEKQGIAVLFGTERRESSPELYLPAENRVLECALSLARLCAEEGRSAELLWVQEEVRERALRSAEDFEKVRTELAHCSFSEKYTDRALFDAAGRAQAVYRSRLVLLILTAASPELMSFARLLERYGIACRILLVTKAGEEGPAEGAELLRIDPEEALRTAVRRLS